MTLKSIITGHLNNLTRFDGDIEALAKERLSICQRCPVRRAKKALGGTCSTQASVKHERSGEYDLVKELKSKGIRVYEMKGEVYVYGCGCPLNAKTRVKEEYCPAGKWGPVFE